MTEVQYHQLILVSTVWEQCYQVQVLYYLDRCTERRASTRTETNSTDGRRRRVDDRHLSRLRPSVCLSSSLDPYVARLASSCASV